MRCCSVARHLEAWPSASDLPRPSRTRKPCPRPTPPGRPSASHLPRLRRTRKSCPGAQVRATSRARAVRESLVRVSHLLIGHAQAASVAVGRDARHSFLLRIHFRVGRQGALAAPKKIRSKKERRATYVRSARQQRHVYFSSLLFLLRTLFEAGRSTELQRLCLVAVSLSLSQPRTPRRYPYLSTRGHAVSRRSSSGTLCRSGAR